MYVILSVSLSGRSGGNSRAVTPACAPKKKVGLQDHDQVLKADVSSGGRAHALVRSSISSSGSRPGVMMLNLVIAKRKTT